jgi:DNA-binding NarL/FixJ family response regulator
MESKGKILIIDDEPAFREDLKAALESRAYEVMAASNRGQAQALARSQRPDLVILGTILPRGDAFMLHQWLKKTPKLATLPILVIDAPLEDQPIQRWRRDRGVQLESEEYLCKPIEPVALLPQIEKLVDRETRRIKVLVTDDHAVVREGIRALLSLQSDIEVVGEAVNGRDAVEKTRNLSPDVVLMDIVMPGMGGLEATKQICAHSEQVKVLMLTQYDDEENVLASSQVGAFGFIPKKSVSSQLLAGIRSATRGEHLKHFAGTA